VSSIVAPTHATVGQTVDLTYTVTNAGGSTVADQEEWQDMVYLSRDRNLDLKADRYLGFVDQKRHPAPGARYTTHTTLHLPTDPLGPFYVFVISDPPTDNPLGKVFEGTGERNNDRPSDVPMVIDYPPPSDLQVTAITAPASVTVGDLVTITW